jgi:septum formation protein
MGTRLILASQSPRRNELLQRMGLVFDIIPSGVTENFSQDEPPREHVLRLSREKAQEVGSRYPDHWVIAADTVVAIDRMILGKPQTREEAAEMLSLLSGRDHVVLTGFSVLHLRRGMEERDAVETIVKVKSLSRDEVEWYIRTAEPFDKAGGYAIQGIGSFMIESIRGSYTNVVGLPMCELIEMLKRLGAIEISDCGFRIAE